MAWEYWLVLTSAAVGLAGSAWLIGVAFKTRLGWGMALLISFLSGLLVLWLPLLGLVFPLIWLIIALAFSVRYWRYAKMPALVVLVALVCQTGGVYALGMKHQAALRTMVHLLRSGEMDRAQLRRFIFAEFIKPAFSPTKTTQREPIKLPEAVEEQALDQMEAQQQQQAAATATDEAVEAHARPPAEPGGTEAEPQSAQTADTDVSEQTAQLEEDEPVVKSDPLQIDLPGAPAPITRPVAISRAHYHMNEYFIVEEKNGVRHEGRLRGIDNGRFLFERKVYNGVFSFQLPQTSIKQLRLRLDMPAEAG